MCLCVYIYTYIYGKYVRTKRSEFFFNTSRKLILYLILLREYKLTYYYILDKYLTMQFKYDKTFLFRETFHLMYSVITDPSLILLTEEVKNYFKKIIRNIQAFSNH